MVGSLVRYVVCETSWRSVNALSARQRCRDAFVAVVFEILHQRLVVCFAVHRARHNDDGRLGHGDNVL